MLPDLTAAELYAIIVAGGTGSRFGGGLPKQFLPLAGVPVIIHTLQRFLSFDAGLRTIVVLPQAYLSHWQALKQAHLSPAEAKRVREVMGGPSRSASVWQGLQLLHPAPPHPYRLVAVQDAVRPFAGRAMLLASYLGALRHGSGVCCVPVKSSLRRVRVDGTSQGVVRDEYRAVQTPQTFNLEVLLAAYENTMDEVFTDEASRVEAGYFKHQPTGHYGNGVYLTEGSYENIKITTPEDLALAELILPRFLAHEASLGG